MEFKARFNRGIQNLRSKRKPVEFRCAAAKSKPRLYCYSGSV